MVQTYQLTNELCHWGEVLVAGVSIIDAQQELQRLFEGLQAAKHFSHCCALVEQACREPKQHGLELPLHRGLSTCMAAGCAGRESRGKLTPMQVNM